MDDSDAAQANDGVPLPASHGDIIWKLLSASASRAGGAGLAFPAPAPSGAPPLPGSEGSGRWAAGGAPLLLEEEVGAIVGREGGKAIVCFYSFSMWERDVSFW